MAEKKEENSDKPKKQLPVMMIMQVLFMVVNLGAVGAGLYFTYMATLGWLPKTITEAQLLEERKAKEASEQALLTPEQKAAMDLGPLIYTFDKFTVNLSGEPKRSIRIEVNLEMLSKDGFEEVVDNDNRARARDQIIKILNDKTFAEVETIQGKLFLKDRIATEINAILDEGVVKDVYFSDFVVQ
jgi:flagellar FliL protein